MKFRPMLSGKAPDDLSKITFPVLVSPKLDGVRALVRGGKVLSRSMKPIPNKHVQKLFGIDVLEGLDGELVVGKPNAHDAMQATTSGVMSKDGEPDVKYYVFDYAEEGYEKDPFKERLDFVKSVVADVGHPDVVFLKHRLVYDDHELAAYEEACVAKGYEGVMLRSLHGPYKQGRSTVREGYLLKMKRFEDSEAEVIGIVQRMHNTNEATKDERGYTKRSSAKEGMELVEEMGTLIVRDIHSGVEFEVGSGFTAQQRKDYWLTQEQLAGKILKYKYQPVGVKDKPRLPIFLGWRDPLDLVLE